MGWLFPSEGSRPAPGTTNGIDPPRKGWIFDGPTDAPDYTFKGKKVTHSRQGNVDKTVEKGGCVWAVLAAAAGSLAAIGAAAGGVARAKGWA